MVLSVVAGVATFAGPAAAASNVSITADDANAQASNATYTATGTIDAEENETLSLAQVNFSLGNATLSNVAANDVTVSVDGEEYLGEYESMSMESGNLSVTLADSLNVTNGTNVTVSAYGVTNPTSDVNATVALSDGNGTVIDTFADTVEMDPVSYSILWINTTETARNSPITVTAMATNNADNETSYNATLVADGEPIANQSGTLPANGRERVNFTPTFPAAGSYDIGIESLSPQTVTVYEETSIVGAVSGTSDGAQTVSVAVADLSLDGGTDWHYLELPNSLAGSVTVEDVSVEGQNVSLYTEEAEIVDGPDGDGTEETLRFATTGDGGGTTNALVTATLSVDAEAGTYPVTARVIDSQGYRDTAENLTDLTVGSASGETGADGTENESEATDTQNENMGNAAEPTDGGTEGDSAGVPGFTAGAALFAAAIASAALIARRS